MRPGAGTGPLSRHFYQFHLFVLDHFSIVFLLLRVLTQTYALYDFKMSHERLREDHEKLERLTLFN